MQRQSLGSPSSKLPIHGGAAALVAAGERDERRASIAAAAGGGDVAGEAEAAEKQIRPHVSRPEKSIHIIPILTLVCFLVLYLCSHDPSPKELDGVGGAARFAVARGLPERRTELAGGDAAAAATRGFRGLREERRRHRKLGAI